MTDFTQPESPVAQLFTQSVVQGSARYWAAHFAGTRRTSVQAALCFAHAMDMLTVASAEVIAEKSVWWHEELTDCTPSSARHPITKALLEENERQSDDSALEANGASIIDALHRHLHGALMSQQRVSIDTPEAWDQYAQLRFGSLHEMLAAGSGMTSDGSLTLGRWAAKLHALGVVRAAKHYDNPRVLAPPGELVNQDPSALAAELATLTASQPGASPANQVLINHELAWWKKTGLRSVARFYWFANRLARYARELALSAKSTFTFTFTFTLILTSEFHQDYVDSFATRLHASPGSTSQSRIVNNRRKRRHRRGACQTLRRTRRYRHS